MDEIKLTGLQGSQVLGFRSALGLVSAVQELPGYAGTRLAWEDGLAVLHSPRSEGELLSDLDEFYKTRGRDPRWGWAGRPPKKGAPHRKGSADRYLEMVREFESHPHRLAWLRGTATDQLVVSHASRGTITACTLWEFWNGMAYTSVLTKAQKVMEKIGRHPGRASQIESTLFGPWLRDCQEPAMGWDPDQGHLNAQLGVSVKATPKTTELFAMVLAIESLALYPVNIRGGRVHTAGFSANGKFCTWPLWRRPLLPNVITAVLDHPAFHREKPDREELRALGVASVFRAQRVRDPNTSECTIYKMLHAQQVL